MTDQFTSGNVLLFFNLMPDDGDSVAYLSPRGLGMVKSSLRFSKLLLATTMPIVYAQYDILLVVNWYHMVAYDYKG